MKSAYAISKNAKEMERLCKRLDILFRTNNLLDEKYIPLFYWSKVDNKDVVLLYLLNITNRSNVIVCSFLNECKKYLEKLLQEKINTFTEKDIIYASLTHKQINELNIILKVLGF